MKVNNSKEADGLEELGPVSQLLMWNDWLLIEALLLDNRVALVVTKDEKHLSFIHKLGRDRKIYTPIQKL